VGQLKDWMSSRNAPAAPIDDLWLVRGAKLNLDNEQAKSLSKEAWVEAVLEDETRKFVSPQGNLVVGKDLNELGESAGKVWGLDRIGYYKMKSEFPNLNGSGIRVGVLDTGIQSHHPEFTNEVVFKDFVNGLTHPYDDHGHGTHVSGTIAGYSVGMAQKATIYMGKIFTAEGSGVDSDILKAMQWMFDPDGNPNTNDFPNLVSNSWGADIMDGVQDVQKFLPYYLAIKAWIHGGIMPIFAAGNSGKSPNGIPGGLPDAIAVGAIAPDSTLAYFSSRGPNLWKIGESVFTFLKPDISAPGVAVNSAFPGNKYASWAGTSMATPHVSGAVALLLQANNKLKFAKVKELLLKSSEPKKDVNFGYGILNVHKLVKLGLGR
jgi:subtilisin family serine protease